MNLSTNKGRVAIEVKTIFELFQRANNYKPNEEEKIAILRNHGYKNPQRIVRVYDQLEERLNHLADSILKESEI
ncbi:hypothetical protein CH379_018390 [Leptospira ellisii]|uniref:Uncharacterized protein n=1 Tax=Leptospira ellisii TaxID=2023197 RepID=A0AAE4U3H4_9LEPT|nr:hypothetical protein [Leptospira ellisii]MDV6237606.1 hypothetical protein [Leptospira ellisii]PKA03582.1 hypothetical protein CH375_16140 [Leptospira ellisii]